MDIKALIEDKKYDQSLKKLNNILSKNQLDLEALTLRAKVYYKLQDFSKAIVDYDQLINLDPSNLDHTADRGLSYHMSGNHTNALKDFNQVIEKEPENPYWYACRAFIKDYIKDYEGSLQDYEKALELDPEDVISLNNKGLVEEKMGYASKAKESFKKADELEGIDLDKEIGHLNIPVEDAVSPQSIEETETSGSSKSAIRVYMETLRALVTSSKERQAFLDFVLRRKHK